MRGRLTGDKKLAAKMSPDIPPRLHILKKNLGETLTQRRSLTVGFCRITDRRLPNG
jgi:hypothetical protein